MIFSLVMGCSLIRTPVALYMAFDIAPGTDPMLVSLKLFVPKNQRGSRLSMNTWVCSGTSIIVGIL